jgi:hypothetical protein
MPRIVRPDKTRIVLSDGDWIDIKARLNAGEQRDMFARMVTNDMNVNTDGHVGGTMEIDPIKGPTAQVLAYLLDWNVKDDDGQVVDIKGQPAELVAGALDMLDPDDYQEIVGVIQAHDHANRAARSQEKKRRSANLSEPISVSPVGVGGGTNG